MTPWLEDAFEPGLVSVIIPTHNRAEMLDAALGSVLTQRHDRIEVVVVDDGSGDGTAAVVAAWQERFRAERGWQLKLLSQEHLGGQHARNLGAQNSRGEFLNYLDDDDLLTADKIAAQMAMARSTGADIVFGPWVPFARLPEGYGLARPQCTKPAPPSPSALEAWLHGHSWKVMAAIIRRGFASRVGPWDVELHIAQDLEFIARCLSHAPHMEYCPQGALLRRDHPGSISRRSMAESERSLIRLAELVEEYALASLPQEVARPALAQYFGRHAIGYHLRGSLAAADYLAGRAVALDPQFAPADKGWSTRLAYSLGGFRLWAFRNRSRDRIKHLVRALFPRHSRYRPIKQWPPDSWPPQSGGSE